LIASIADDDHASSQPPESTSTAWEDYFRTLVKHSSDIISILNADGSRRFINPTVEPVLGYKPEELIGESVFDLLDPADVPALVRLFARQMRKFGASITGEIRCRDKAGSWHILEVTATNLLHNPIIRGIVINARDVTKRKQAEAKLKQADRRYRQLFEQAHDAIIIFDPRTEIVWQVNQRACEIYGFSRSEFIGMSLEAISSDVARGKSYIEATLEKRYVRNFETVHYRKDGTAMFLEINAAAIEYKGQAAILSINRDVTDRKRAENVLRESESKYRRIVETANEGIGILDAEAKIQYVNHRLTNMLGYSAKEMSGRYVYEFMEESARVNAERDIQQRVQGVIEQRDLRFRRKDGSELWALVSANQILDENDKFIGALCMLTDITKRRIAEEKLRSSRGKLRALSAHLESVRENERTRVAREIHDGLGQALTGLKMDLAWFNKRLPENGEEPASTAMQERIKSMCALIDTTIQSVRRICADLRPGILDEGLTAAIEWQTREFQTRTEITSQFSLPAEETALDHGRSTVIFRIYQEILTNIARHANATRVEIGMTEESGMLELKVSDNGKGINHREISDAESLGLLGMRERAFLLGGDVTINTVNETGTTVIVRIPLAERRKSCRQ
jgi:PAS domain S-box-containing protein